MLTVTGKTLPAQGTAIHPGMPDLPLGARFAWYRRKLSDKMFYMVPTLMLLTLSLRYRSVTLPTLANPDMEVGGVWGERKSQALSLFGPAALARVAPYVTFLRGSDAEADLVTLMRILGEKGIGFPLIIKPDRGYQGWGVREVKAEAALLDYLKQVGAGVELVLQARIIHEGEAGLFYIRDPQAERGRVVSMTLTYAPHVIGDGKRSVAELIADDTVLRPNLQVFRDGLGPRAEGVPDAGVPVVLTNTRSARLGSVYRDVTERVTPALEAAIDEIARDVKGFHFGRFDIRFRDLDAFLQGQDFQIVELNGSGAEMLHIWDGRGRLRDAYATLSRQYRCAYAIGAAMRGRGHRPAGLRQMFRMQQRQERLRRKCPNSL